jgi:hypothetical protein
MGQLRNRHGNKYTTLNRCTLMNQQQSHNMTSYENGSKGNTGKGKVVPLLNRAPRHEHVLGQWRHSPMHSPTPAPNGGKWPAPPPGRFNPRNPPDRRPGGPQRWPEHGVEEKNSPPPPGIEPRPGRSQSPHRPSYYGASRTALTNRKEVRDYSEKNEFHKCSSFW